MHRFSLPPTLAALAIAFGATADARGDAPPAEAPPPAPAEAPSPPGAKDPLADYLDQVRAQRRAQRERLRVESRSESERARREQREAAEEHWRAHREQAEQRRDPAGQQGPGYPPGWGIPWYFQGW